MHRMARCLRERDGNRTGRRRAALQQMGGSLKHPMSLGCLPSACSVAEANNLNPNRADFLFLRACLISPWIFPAITHQLLSALKTCHIHGCFPGMQVPCLTILQYLHAARRAHLHQPPSLHPTGRWLVCSGPLMRGTTWGRLLEGADTVA